MNRIDETRPFIPVNIAVLTVSDTRTEKTDKSGDVLAAMIAEAGHHLADRAIVTDDAKDVRKQVKKWIKDPEIDVVITTGGTGFSERDVTPEAVKPLFDKEIDALVEKSEAALDFNENVKLVKEIQLEAIKRFTSAYTVFTLNDNNLLSSRVQNYETSLCYPVQRTEMWMKRS